MDEHDGADAIERAWRDGLKPDPLLTVSEWADRYQVLSQRASSEPGRWRTERTPYLREIMDCLSPGSPLQRVALMKGAQIGGTECGNCWVGYVIHQAPGPMMAVAPTVELAKRNSKQRIDPPRRHRATLSLLGGRPAKAQESRRFSRTAVHLRMRALSPRLRRS
jgi:phage terminase large subunit GpA-like protein